MTQQHAPMTLIILDGFGHRTDKSNNAIAQANTPNIDTLFKDYAHTFISASGHDVGLPDQQMGNSEVGHLNIGAGRMVPQELTRVDMAITDGTFQQNAALLKAINHANDNDKALHVMGLLSAGGVHSHENHLLAMLALAKSKGVKKLYLHAFLDGRDTPPQSALASLQKIEAQGAGKIVSMIGRYFAMDRDNRWERVQQAYDLLTLGKADFHSDTAEQALEAAYSRDENDEFVQATTIGDGATIDDGDSVVFMNFRADRAREITKSFVEKNFDGFTREKTPALSDFVCLTQYHKDFDVSLAYPKLSLQNTFGEVLAQHGLTQLRIAETEKYAHVTFFFNGGIDEPNTGEERLLIPSPKVATYDLQPEMSAYELTDALVNAIKNKKFDAIICNYANPDMVGHTGNLKAAIKAIEVVDDCVGKVIAALKEAGGEALVTADHGNAEQMFNEETGQPHTAHTNELVPMIYVGRNAQVAKTNGVLADIAPTMLYLMEVEKPQEMTGESIFVLS
jgi:2,3-bisphosphoglycerate-independent phosphoglycerate mutase